MMTAELIDSQLALNFLKCPERRKTNFYRLTTIPVLQFYVKELLWNEKSREHRRAKSNRVWCAECFWRARRSRSEFLRGDCGGQTVAWFYGCRRVMRTPQSPTKGPDQDDLIRNMLKHSRRRRDLSMMRRIRVM